MRTRLRAEHCHPFASFLKTPTSKIVGKLEEYGFLRKSGINTDLKVSTARRQPGGCRVGNSQAKTKKPPVSVISFPENAPGNSLVLVEGFCGKVTPDLKLSGGFLRNVYLFLEASRRRAGSTMVWAGVNLVGILTCGAPSKEEISPRGCQKVP